MYKKVALAGLIFVGASLVFVDAHAAPVTIGETTILANADNGNGNLLVAQNATLTQTATIQSLSFYVTQAGGNLRLGIYDATGPSGGPGALKAQTNSFTPTTGWNTQNVVTQVQLSPGTYWIAYFPSSNTLAFRKTTTAGISGKFYTLAFGAMPAIFSTTPTNTPSHWSFYATLNTGTSSPDITPPSGTVVINNGTAATKNTAVTLQLTATDTQSGVTQMRFSNTGTSFNAAVAFASSTSWTLTTGAGTKTVYAQFKDAAGNWSSATTTDTIVLDTTAPTISAVASSSITQNSATITWTTNETADSQVNYGLTASYGATTTLDSTLVTSHSVVLSGLAPNTLYNFRVRSSDAAGNLSVSGNATFKTLAGADTTAPSQPTNLTATPVSQTQINLQWATSTDNVAVAGYKVFNNGTQIATTTLASYNNTGLTPGTNYLYVIVAFDTSGNLSTPSQSVNATTQSPPPPDTIAPTVDVTAPADSSTVSGIVSVTATSSDNVGVVGVQFLLEGSPLGAEDTAAPYQVSWNTTSLPNGDHHISARARDAAGNIATSSIHHIDVENTAATGLVAAYSFSEGIGTTLTDASGNAHTGTLVNGPTWISGQAGHGNALDFDGTNDYVSIGDLDLIGSFTVSFWGRADSLASGCHGSAVMKQYDYGFEVCDGKMLGQVGTGSGGFGSSVSYTIPQAGVWNFYTLVYDGTTDHLFVNGTEVSSATRTHGSNNNPLLLGSWNTSSEFFNGAIDDVRIYSRALTATEIQTDMANPVGGGNSSDPTPPTVSITSPASGAQVSNIITVTADADDNVGVVGVQFLVDGTAVGAEDTQAPYGVDWDTRLFNNGAHTLTARARDAAGNIKVSTGVSVNIVNSNFFQNEILATGFNLPTTLQFLPDGRLLVGEIAGVIKVLPPPYTTPDPTPFLNLDIQISGYAGLQQGIFDIALDPNFTTNHYFYVFYTNDSPNRDRLSRFTANANLTGTTPGSEVILYEDPQVPNTEHHGGAINFGNDGKIYFTTGEHFDGTNAQNLTNPRGKIHRINPDGTVPTDNPFYDGAGPNWDSIWAIGLRNPFRAYYDIPTGRLLVADVGGNNYATAYEEVDLGVRGANYGWPNCEFGTCGNSNYTAALYAYPHNGRDASITGGFVYHGAQFPSGYQGNYFFADYAQNWIKRLTFDAQGNVSGVFNFEPIDGSLDGPYGDIVDLAEGPDGALYYLDLGYSDVGGTFSVSKLRRIRYLSSNLPPTAIVSANPTSGQVPLTVNFSSASSTDPEGSALTYLWTFGDGATSTAANPQHLYSVAGQYTVRLTTSDGTNQTISTPLVISVGTPPTATIFTPIMNSLFRGGDTISFSGVGSDLEDGTLPASAFTWTIDFLHAGHVHPGPVISGVKNGTFVIPVSGHDFSGDTRYRFLLTVTDSNGLQYSTTTLIYPDKVNLTFDTVPSGVTLYLDGIAKQTPFVYDTLINFQHSIEARNASTATTTYTFSSWSDGGAQTHTVTVPTTTQTYIATYNVSTSSTPFNIGETSVLPGNDNGNGNLLVAQNVVLGQSATLQSLSFNVNVLGGDLRLGLYDASGAGGNPGNLLAQTNSFTPVIGWNTQNVLTPTLLAPGNYWLAYLPQSSSLGFPNDTTIGQYRAVAQTFGPLPTVFPTPTLSAPTHWSFYGTLTP